MAGMSEEEYKKLQENFSKADPRLKKEIVDQIAASLYEDIHFEAKKAVGKSNGQASATSIVMAAYLRILGFFTGSGKLEEYETLNDFINLIRKIIYCALIDKYRKNKREGFLGASDEPIISLDEFAEEASIPNDFVHSVMISELADKFLEILSEILAPEELDFLIARFAKGETYADIVASHPDAGLTKDSVRMRINRIQERIRNHPRVIELKKDYEQDE